MRQPERAIYRDLDRCTFNDFLDTLLDRDNFNFFKEVDGRPMISPSWSFCLSYEFEIRKEAFRLCKEQQYGIQAAVWATLCNTEHRMKHWLQLIAIPNAPSSSSGFELQPLKKRIADLEKARSGSSRRKEKQASLGSGPTMLPLPAPASRPQASKEGKGNRKSKKGKGKGSSSPAGPKNFEYLMKLPVDFRKNFHDECYKKEICYRFQSNSWNLIGETSKFSHICVGCGGSKPHDDCRCLQSKIH